jgi:GntR family transcriptional regulator, transcriptional repressor for pyruvate dehydrogenase complex
VTVFDGNAPLTSGQRESQAGRIARLLVRRIQDGTYPVGTRIPSERVLSQEFSVSRPVVREALSNVSALDILDIQMGRGAFVTAVPADRTTIAGSNLQDVVNVREILEVGALRLCQGRPDLDSEPVQEALDRLSDAVSRREETAALDRALHSEIIRASGSAILVSLWQDLEKQIDETIRISPHGHSMNATILDQHRRLADGVISRNTGAATEASREMHEQNRIFLRNLLG